MTARTGRPIRILMSLDAIGGVWRYAMELAAGLRPLGIETVFAGFGPRPTAQQAEEAGRIGKLIWTDGPLDWMVEREDDVAQVPELISELARREAVDLVHVNLPSQAARLQADVPVVVASHSCVVTWFAAVRGSEVLPDWQWQQALNRAGYDRADAVIAPSQSFALLLEQAYGKIDHLSVIPNSSSLSGCDDTKEPFVFAAGRWWDEGKNGAVLDAAAALTAWPVVMAGANKGPTGQYLPLKQADHRGDMPHGQTMDLMRKAAVFVSPSIYEPFGLAPLEAARAGAALVLSDIPTYRELWDGAALFAEASNPAAFADALNRLAADENERAALARRASDRSMRFNPQIQAASFNTLYRDQLGQSISQSAAE